MARSTEEAIIDATIRCLARNGHAEGVTVEAIAREAGCTRQTVYRLFGNRHSLLRAVASARVVAMGRDVAPFFRSGVQLEEALVEGTLIAVTRARSDHLLLDIVATTADHDLELQLFRGSQDVREMVDDLYLPLVRDAAKRGCLRVSDEAMVMDWIRNVLALLYIRYEDYSAEERANLLAKFFLPSLIRE